MSADNWTTCPQCKEEDTLREDYEIGTDEEGLFYVDYSCGCSACGFRFSYKFDKDVLKGNKSA